MHNTALNFSLRTYRSDGSRVRKIIIDSDTVSLPLTHLYRYCNLMGHRSAWMVLAELWIISGSSSSGGLWSIKIPTSRTIESCMSWRMDFLALWSFTTANNSTNLWSMRLQMQSMGKSSKIRNLVQQHETIGSLYFWAIAALIDGHIIFVAASKTSIMPYWGRSIRPKSSLLKASYCNSNGKISIFLVPLARAYEISLLPLVPMVSVACTQLTYYFRNAAK